MSSPSELSLDCKPLSHSMLLKSFGQHNDHTQKLEEFLSRLEEERQKIDVFKRELPLCMQLLTNAVETSRQQLQAYRANQDARPILEEFMPLKNSTSEALDKSEKVSWMTTAQLWSHEGDETKPQPTFRSDNKETNDNLGFSVSPKLCLDTKQRNGGAFLPFSKERNLCPSPTLALASPDKEMDQDIKCSESDHNGFSCPKRDNNSGNISNGRGGGAIEQGKGSGNSSPDGHTTSTGNGNNTNTAAANQTHRKARRCWSPDLHRRFVNALQMLGGSQVATPKQIRELMKVEGLTNDEVKSHLQKYRLHTRRPSPSPQAAAAPAPQLVVLGGIWVPPEYATAAAAGPTIYGGHHHPASHATPPHFCAAPPHQDFYTTAPAPPPPHHLPLHHQLQIYEATSQPPHDSSPESDMRGTGGELSESIEDGKSESNSWKADQNGGDRKGLLALREDGEESNGSEITLKF